MLMLSSLRIIDPHCATGCTAAIRDRAFSCNHVVGLLLSEVPFNLTYEMTTGSGVSCCFKAADALGRHRELLLAGATGIVVTVDGHFLTLVQLQALASISGPIRQ